MMGTLLRMSGVPTREEFKDLILRWLVLADREAGEHWEPQKVGNHLIEVYGILGGDPDDEDEREPLIAGEELFRTMFKAWCGGNKPRIIRELKRRGRDHDHVTDDWIRSREVCDLHWTEAFDISTAAFPASLAKEVAHAMGENSASDSISMWAYHEKMEKERASV